MTWLAEGAGYIAVHGGLYVLALRHLACFGREIVIFAYHVVPFVFLTGLRLIWLALDPSAPEPLTTLAILLMIALYSFSFLELWALSDGGYSISIMARVDSLGGKGETLDVTDLLELGDAKKRSRVASLSRLGLIRPAGDRLVLTPLGWLISRGLRLIAWLVRIRQTG
jgi:hypothetical protein